MYYRVTTSCDTGPLVIMFRTGMSLRPGLCLDVGTFVTKNSCSGWEVSSVVRDEEYPGYGPQEDGEAAEDVKGQPPVVVIADVASEQ